MLRFEKLYKSYEYYIVIRGVCGMFKKRGIHESFLVVLVVIFTLLFLSFVVAESNTEFRLHFIAPDNNSFFGPNSGGEPSFDFNINGTNATYEAIFMIDGGASGGPLFIANGTDSSTALASAISAYPDGEFIFYFQATNGSTTNYTAENRTFTIDNTVPLIDWGSLTNYPDDAYINTNSFFFEVTYTEVNRANLTFTAFDPFSGAINTTVISDQSTFTFNLSSIDSGNPLVEANYTLNATIWDNATNSNITTNRLVILDSFIPQIDYQAATLINNSNISSNSFIINMSYTDANFANLTFRVAPVSYSAMNTTVVSEWSTPYLNFSSLVGESGFAEGNYTINVTMLDRASNQNISGIRNFLIDSTLPSLSYHPTVQPNEAFVSADYIYVKASVADANLINLTFRLTNTTGSTNVSVLSDTLGDGATKAINFTQIDSKAGNLPNGNYTFNITATDRAENQKHKSSRTIIIDALPPSGDYHAATTVANNSNVSTAYAFFNMTFTEQNLGNLTFKLSTIDYSTYANNTAVSEWSTPYTNFTDLVDGNYTFNVTILDRASNSKQIAVRTFFYDPTLPVVSYTHGSAVAGASGTNSTSIFVNVSIVESNLINLTFNFRNTTGVINTTVISDEIGDSNLTYLNFTLMDTKAGNFPEGNYTFNVTATDRMGNRNTSVNGIIIVDRTFPNIDLHASSVANNTNLTSNAIFVRVNLTETNLANVTFTLVNSSFVNKTVVTDTNVSFVNFSRLGDGYYQFNVTVTDVANQINFTETRNVTVDTTAPSAIAVSASPTSINGGESVSLACGATDNLGGDISYVIDVQQPSGSYVTQTTSASATYTDTASLAGTYNVRCTVTDVYGNSAADSTSFSVSISSGSSSSSGSSGGSSASYAPEVEEEEEEEVEEVEEEVIEEITAAVILEEESSWEETGILEYSTAVLGDVIEMTFTTSEGTEEAHSVTLSEVNTEEQFVVLLFASEPQELTVYVGESRNLDIDSDGTDDFEVALNAINEDGTVDLTLTKLEGWLENEGVEQKSYWWVGLVLALGIVAGIAWFFIAKKK
jgi:hypothetical protein